MDSSFVEEVWGAVSERVGEDLRAVTHYEGTQFESRMREDVRAKYTDEEDRAVVDDTIVKQLSLADTERTFKTGDLEALVRVFEDAWVLSWTTGAGRKSGVIVSLQRDGGIATMEDVEWCIGYLDEEIAPRMD